MSHFNTIEPNKKYECKICSNVRDCIGIKR